MENEDIRDSARDFFADITHTICQDILEGLVAKGVCSREDAEVVIAEQAKKWVKEGIRIKKRPAPRQATKKTKEKDVKSDYQHLYDNTYFLKSHPLGGGAYPMYDTEKGVFWAAYYPKNNSYDPLTEAHKRALRISGLPIDGE